MVDREEYARWRSEADRGDRKEHPGQRSAPRGLRGIYKLLKVLAPKAAPLDQLPRLRLPGT